MKSGFRPTTIGANSYSIHSIPPIEVSSAEVVGERRVGFGLAMLIGGRCVYIERVLLFPHVLHPFILLAALPRGGACVARREHGMTRHAALVSPAVCPCVGDFAQWFCKRFHRSARAESSQSAPQNRATPGIVP